MGQYYLFVNIDKWQRSGGLGKWGEFMDDPDIYQWIRATKMIPLEELLASRDATSYELTRRVDGSPPDSGSFNKIPDEIIAQIFNAMPYLQTMILFSLTNSRLFAIGYPIFAQILVYIHSPWPYDRIICIGDYAKDLPSGYLTEDDKLSLLEGLPGPPDSESRAGVPYTDEETGNLNLYHIASDIFPRIRSSSSPSSTLSDPSDTLGGRAFFRMGRSDFLRYLYFMEPLRPAERVCKPIAEPVLVNLTKKQYIRQAEGKIKFEVVIPQLVVWGQESYDWILERGPWAGDRLAVVEMEELTGRIMKQEDGWKDFTEEGLEYQRKFLGMFK